MAHVITGKGKQYYCTVCRQTWKSKPQSECPGIPVYEFGKAPDGLAKFDDLFAKGLTLAEGQKPVARIGKYTDLFALADCKPHGLNIEFNEGKYKFIETPTGFDIYRVNGLCVKVWFENTHLTLQRQPQFGLRSAMGYCGLYNWKEALSSVAESLARALVSDDVEEATEMISKALNYRFFQGWQRIIKEIAPKEVVDLARLMWASTQDEAAVLHNPDLYTDEHKHTRADLLKYHACRMYAATTNNLEDVAHWRERLSPTVPNKALNKTLDKMPVAVSFRQIHRLSTIQLVQPVTNRLHLIFILCASDHHNWGLHERIVVTATPEMVQEAAALFGERLTARSKTRWIGNVATRILDYPLAYHGDLLGLARRSHEWHEEIGRANHTASEPGLLPADTPLVLPEGVDLAALEADGIRLLRTAGDCYAERDRMRHCIHTYASKAASGACYLFHVDYATPDGVRYQASVEVAPDGTVLQAHGPENIRNPACEYGVRKLSEAFKRKDKR